MAFKMKPSSFKQRPVAITMGGTGVTSGIEDDKTNLSMTLNPGVRIGNLNLGYERGFKRIGGREGDFSKIRNITGDYRFFTDSGITGSLSGKYGTDTSISGSLGFGNKPYQSRRHCGPTGCFEIPISGRRFDIEGYGKYNLANKNLQAGIRGRYGWLTGEMGYDFGSGKPTFLGGVKIPFGKQQ
jgi:hypothetical protein